MSNENKDLFQDLVSQESYQELIKQLPEDERPFLEKYIKELFDKFVSAIPNASIVD